MTHHPDHEVELFRDEDAYEVYVDLPGYDCEDVDLHWHDSRLHIEAEHVGESGTRQVYDRHVTVPHRVDADRIAATFDEDVLTVHLPLAGEARSPGTRIDVTEE